MSKFIEISVDELTALQNEIKQAKILIQQLRDSKKPIPKNTLYDYVFENVTSALMLGTPDGRIIEVNSAACKIFGYSKEEFLTKTRTDLLVVDENFKKFLSEREKNGIARAIVINKRKNGEPFKSELSSNIFKDQNGTEYACFNVVDISEKEKLEALLKTTLPKALVNFGPATVYNPAASDVIRTLAPCRGAPVVDSTTIVVLPASDSEAPVGALTSTPAGKAPVKALASKVIAPAMSAAIAAACSSLTDTVGGGLIFPQRKIVGSDSA